MLFEVMLQKFFKAVHPLLQRGEKPADMMPVCRRVMAGYGQGQPQLSFFLCFCCCFAISTVISVRKESLDNQKLADGLKHLKEDQKHDND